jgi:hypothetical protein
MARGEPMAETLLSKTNLAQIAKVLALLFFFLPWVTVSCADQTLVSMTGVDLATGHVTMHNPMTNQMERPPGAESGDLLVILGAVLILAALAATFVLRGRNGLIAGIAGSALAAAALCYTVLVRIPATAHSSASIPGAGPGSMGPTPAEMAQMIEIETQIGFWLTILALAAAVLLDVLALRPAAVPSPPG